MEPQAAAISAKFLVSFMIPPREMLFAWVIPTRGAANHGDQTNGSGDVPAMRRLQS
jgi:hypothetical protein